MWIAIAVVAAAVLVVAAFAGLGRFGEMPRTAVTDRPKGHVPDGALTPELLAELRIPTAFTGYRREQVDQHLAGRAGNPAEEPAAPLFDVVRGGYDMQVVDQLIERPRPAAEPVLPPQTGEILEDTE